MNLEVKGKVLCGSEQKQKQMSSMFQCERVWSHFCVSSLKAVRRRDESKVTAKVVEGNRRFTGFVFFMSTNISHSEWKVMRFYE